MLANEELQEIENILKSYFMSNQNFRKPTEIQWHKLSQLKQEESKEQAESHNLVKRKAKLEVTMRHKSCANVQTIGEELWALHGYRRQTYTNLSQILREMTQTSSSITFR